MKAEMSANLVLENLWEPRPFPVDPAWISNRMGLDVLVVDLPDRISGALVKKREEDPVIFLNKADHRNRQRFTCAHELGHYIGRTQQDGEQYEYIDLRGDLSSTGQSADEIFANQFAANLLMPANEVKRLSKEGQPPFIMAVRFDVSDDAIRFRLKNLGLDE